MSSDLEEEWHFLSFLNFGLHHYNLRFDFYSMKMRFYCLFVLKPLVFAYCV